MLKLGDRITPQGQGLPRVEASPATGTSIDVLKDPFWENKDRKWRAGIKANNKKNCVLNYYNISYLE
jgi:hypothetical protein